MIIGHESAINDFKDLIARGKLGHGYIFFGPAMVGKRTVALGLGRFLEKGIFDASANNVDDETNEVLQELKMIDVAFMKSLDEDASGGSIGIDAVREIKNFLWQKPNMSARRTLIIDNADLLTTEAQNALLKITEEPPASSLLILVTSDVESLLPTIVSRLPKIYFGAVPQKTIEKGIDPVVAKRALGKQGLAWRLSHNKEFRENLEAAEKFLKTPAAGRRDFIKKLIEPDDFSLRNFLDSVIMVLAWQETSPAKAAFWHKTLRLYESTTNFTLNPRLQLEALMK
jgi:DNA polymerase III delta prime subunit